MDAVETAMNKKEPSKYLSEYSKMSKENIVRDRYEKFRAMGVLRKRLKKNH
jgi:acetyl-CoA carboxylase alpha subunit